MKWYREEQKGVGLDLVQLLVTETGNLSDLKKVEVYFHMKELKRGEVKIW